MLIICLLFFFFKQKTAYEMRISDWSSDVCSSDLTVGHGPPQRQALDALRRPVRRHLVAGHAPDLFRIGLEEDREQLVAEGVDGPVLEGTDVAPGKQPGLGEARHAKRRAPQIGRAHV